MLWASMGTTCSGLTRLSGPSEGKDRKRGGERRGDASCRANEKKSLRCEQIRNKSLQVHSIRIMYS